MPRQTRTILSVTIALLLFQSAFIWAQSIGRSNSPSQEALIAFDNVRFGENSDSVNTKLPHSIELGEHSFYPLAFYVDSYPDPNPDSNLYAIRFRSERVTANYYDTEVADSWKAMLEVLSLKYGKKAGTFPSFLRLRSGYSSISHTWQIGTKRLELGVESTHDSRYAAILYITELSREQFVNNRQKRAEDEQKNAASKKF